MVAKKSSETGGASQATEKRGDSALQEKQERIIRAAKGVFLKYGYTRVTMSDLAQAAGMSRPALYLVFAKKEDVFGAVVRQMAREVSEDVHEGLAPIKSALDKLKFVCEIWMVRPFDWLNQSPEAREIYEGSHEFARDAVVESMLLFEHDLASVLKLFPKGTLPKGISPDRAAQLLAGAIVGIKKTCGNSSELRENIHALIAMMIRS
jgi:AcrR family transcriptional regulator